MTDFIDSVMGFNPADLSVFKEDVKADFNQNVYKPNPKDSKSEDGNYRSRIRVIYNPNDLNQSIVKQATYAMNDQDGFFMVKSKLGNGDKECPIFKSWKRLWFSGDENKKDWAKKMYEKTESQWVLIQVIEDSNRPELVGQIKVMKLPKAIYTKMTALMNPAPETKKTPVPVMDYIFGRVLEMDVAPGPDDPANPSRKQREISYDLCSFEADPTPVIKVDGTPLFTDDELELIDLYNGARNDLLKAKTDKKKQEAQAILTENRDKVKELYGKVVAYLKDNSIDLVKECTYQPWDEATEKRVQNWIDIVATLHDPKSVSATETPTSSHEAPAQAPKPAEDAIDEFAGDFDEPLPF